MTKRWHEAGQSCVQPIQYFQTRRMMHTTWTVSSPRFNWQQFNPFAMNALSDASLRLNCSHLYAPTPHQLLLLGARMWCWDDVCRLLSLPASLASRGNSPASVAPTVTQWAAITDRWVMLSDTASIIDQSLKHLHFSLIFITNLSLRVSFPTSTHVYTVHMMLSYRHQLV